MEIEAAAYALHREQEGSALHTLWFFSLPLSSESPSPSGPVRSDPGTVPSYRHKRSLKVPRTYTGHHPASLLPPITASDRPALTRSESDAIVPPLSLAPVSSPATTASSKIVRPAHPRITALSPGCPLHDAAEHAPTRQHHRPATDSTHAPGPPRSCPACLSARVPALGRDVRASGSRPDQVASHGWLLHPSWTTIRTWQRGEMGSVIMLTSYGPFE